VFEKNDYLIQNGKLPFKKKGWSGHQISSWHLMFLSKAFMFCICSVFCSMNEESVIERLQIIVREKA
jgi:hypothetical protein